jgi:asparagine synthase (glutamine-hydrolysing)
MCGIAGWVDRRTDLSERSRLVEVMGAQVACRGPDAEGLFVTPHAVLAHRRLIVIDPEGGQQPMQALSAPVTLVYNGELYNTDEVREELKTRGYRFRSWSDTEVVLNAYLAWGTESPRHLNGIFAIAIYDRRDETLFLARDRLGVKPLFYARLDDGGLLFGSEPKAILAHPAFPHEVDAEGLNEVLTVGPARTPGVGIYRRMAELAPGMTAVFDGERLRSARYWRLVSEPHRDDVPTTIATVGELVRDAVTRQLVSDVGVCTFLSGGLDSSVVTAIAAGQLSGPRQPLDTYSVDFVDQDLYFQPTTFQQSLDAPWARRVSDHLGTRHRAVVLDNADLVEYLVPSLAARDFPGMADIDTSLYLFCRAIRQDHVMALSGEAADEVFGGYPWCHRPDALQAETFPWARRLPDRIGILDPGLVALLHPEEYVRSRYEEALREVPTLSGESRDEARIREVLYLNLTRFLPTLLDRKDRMSMAHGLEVRVPFCDHRLVEYVWNIPWSIKSLGGTPKGVLREAARGLLPDDVIDRPKMPYPTTHHPQYAASFRDQLRQVMADSTSPLVGLVNRPRVMELLDMDPRAWDLPWFGQMMGVPALFAYLVQCDAWLRDQAVTIRI